MKFKEAQAAAVYMISSPEFIERIREEDDSMLKHLDLLKTINQLGYITTESQAGNKKVGKSSEIMERAYINGFMLETYAIKFIKNMAILTDKNAVHIPRCSDDIHLPASLDIPLTIVKKDDTVVVHTHMATAVPISHWDQERKQAKLNKSDKIVYISCWDTKWNRDASSATGLFTDVIKILKG
jgi:hypothetical protein